MWSWAPGSRSTAKVCAQVPVVSFAASGRMARQRTTNVVFISLPILTTQIGLEFRTLHNRQVRYCLALLPLLLPMSVMGQQLTVKAASARHVVLVWAGSGASWIVERKAGESTWQKAATPSAAT